ncbi:PTS glucose transporter subunit IIBC [Leptotrichia sp. OH3620_COT-345]|uniref:N-acetylglucosamine-specific PTS transporter subunit IIBC n=1 Tax=Leptotrichia sp. OH3620_COT-345 TaxID=2491048 RepID=UPI000F646734|nr:N-acetylglucosamine-specific PTS transporter subunit IIBC [Leptotrichia sp. OH3620_COT-345]RRD39955.1 PTS glucose transporter subunit IIBC [Leptotrichia sp. OH3620_COT-345]
MMKYLQRIGKSLMLPVAVLPAAAILLGIGYRLDPTGWGANSPMAAFLIKSGASILDNMAILFAVGIAVGMSKDRDGSSALAGLVGFLVITTLLSKDSVAVLTKVSPDEVSRAFGKINNPFIGILSGTIAAEIYNRFYKTQLPMALAFFSGKRLVPILTATAMLVLSPVLFFTWPVIFGALVAFGESFLKLGPLGAGIFGFFNRLLIPLGLHHALNAVFWFDIAGINDIGNFLGGTGTKGITGMYQAGYFPIMMFGLPAAAFAMYQAAKPEKKEQVASLMLAAGVTSFVTGVTEPLEFAFMFVAPLLYVVHAVLTGISMFISALFGWTAGFGFSAGLIDFTLTSGMPMASRPFMLIIQGLVFGVIYYLMFKVLIAKLNLMTPGREEDNDDEVNIESSNSNHAEVAKIIYEALGGKENIVSVDNCATRLRLEVKDSTLIEDKKIKQVAAGIMKPSKTSVQVVIGPLVEFVADEMKKL